ncbi:hypothetical protein PM082_016463 [Marasmius tenuissimus]|nr:hypothetical protein PM082_016463 [Marasmius tenuissimus]
MKSKDLSGVKKWNCLLEIVEKRQILRILNRTAESEELKISHGSRVNSASSKERIHSQGPSALPLETASGSEQQRPIGDVESEKRIIYRVQKLYRTRGMFIEDQET